MVWEDTYKKMEKHNGNTPNCNYCGKPLTPIDDMGNFICCQEYNTNTSKPFPITEIDPVTKQIMPSKISDNTESITKYSLEDSLGID